MGAIVVLQPEATFSCSGRFSPFDVVAFGKASPSHIGGERIRSNAQIRRIRAGHLGGEGETLTPLVVEVGADGAHSHFVVCFGGQARNCEGVGVGIPIGDLTAIHINNLNNPSGGFAVFGPTQHGAVRADF